jgi:hypothetical protein
MTKAKKWNPDKGDAMQGDVILFRVPDGIKIATTDEIAARDNGLVLAEGEVTGHHHVIKMVPQPVLFHDEALARELTASQTVGTAKLYRDATAVRALVRADELTTDRLAIGFLIVEDASVALSHDEHDTIIVPPGRYYVGGQREWDAAEERRVRD